MKITHIWVPTYYGQGRAINAPTRALVREVPVELLGPVAYEPTMSRVRVAGEVVRRVPTCELRPAS